MTEQQLRARIRALDAMINSINGASQMAAFKLTKDEVVRRDKLADELRGLWGKVEDAVNEHNAALELLRTPVEAALDLYNAALEEAQGFAFDIANQADSDISDKSEKWQEGEKGQAAGEYRDAWQGVDFVAVEIDWPSEISVDTPDHGDDLEALPTEAQS